MSSAKLSKAECLCDLVEKTLSEFGKTENKTKNLKRLNPPQNIQNSMEI